jgi:hypothetical protein
VVLKEAPEGFILRGGPVPARQDEVRLTLTAPRSSHEEPLVLRLEGRASIQQREVSHPAVPAEDMMQAFAYRHLVPAQELKVLASSLVAAGRQQKGRRTAERGGASVARLLPEEVRSTLTGKQKQKIAALQKEFGSRLAELAKKRNGILTAEQKKAQAEARKAASDAGKKGRELQQAVNAAVKWTPEQRRRLADLRKDSLPLNKTIRDRLMALLTAEQKAKMPKWAGGKVDRPKASLRSRAEGEEKSGSPGNDQPARRTEE